MWGSVDRALFEGGFVVSWSLSRDVPTTDALIVEVIRYGARLATPWSLMGSMGSDPEAAASRSGSSRISVAGASMITWSLRIGRAGEA